MSSEKFMQLFKEKLGDIFSRAEKVYKNYGTNNSFDVMNVLFHAVDKEKVEEVLDILEKHYEKDLSFQHPDIRGLVQDNLLGVNKTKNMFLSICVDTLGLKSNGS